MSSENETHPVLGHLQRAPEALSKLILTGINPHNENRRVAQPSRLLQQSTYRPVALELAHCARERHLGIAELYERAEVELAVEKIGVHELACEGERAFLVH